MTTIPAAMLPPPPPIFSNGRPPKPSSVSALSLPPAPAPPPPPSPTSWSRLQQLMDLPPPPPLPAAADGYLSPVAASAAIAAPPSEPVPVFSLDPLDDDRMGHFQMIPPLANGAGGASPAPPERSVSPRHLVPVSPKGGSLQRPITPDTSTGSGSPAQSRPPRPVLPKGSSLVAADAHPHVAGWSPARARPRKNEKFRVELSHEGRVAAEDVPATMNPHSIKTHMIALYEHLHGSTGGGLQAAAYVLKLRGVDVHLQNEQLPLHRVLLLQVCSKSGVSPRFELCERSGLSPETAQADNSSLVQSEAKAELALQTELQKMVGADALVNLTSYEHDEVDTFRSRMLNRMLQWREELQSSGADPLLEAFPEYVESEPLPRSLPRPIIVLIYFAQENAGKTEIPSKKIDCAQEDTVDELRAKAFRKHMLSANQSRNANKTVEDYWLKVTGVQEYMFGRRKVLDYDYIRRCLSKGQPIELTMVECAPLIERARLENYRVSLAEALLLQRPDPPRPTPIAFDLAQLSKLASASEEERNATPWSIYTVNRPLKIRISSLENLPRDLAQYVSLHKENLLEEGQSEPILGPLDPNNVGVWVLAELYNSGFPLCDPICTPLRAYSSASAVRWSESFVFPRMLVSNLPACARLSLTVYRRALKEGARAEDQAAPTGVLKDRDFPLCWVNLLLTDHRGTLRSGLESVKLWPVARANPIGTCVENIGSREAPALVIEFESFFRPVAYPEDPPWWTEPPKNLPLPKDALFEKKLDEIVSRDPLSPLSSDDHVLLWHWRAALISKPHALPKLLLACLSKADSNMTLEMHRLIGCFQLSPMQALELLDAKFMDPVVRRYAVQRLESLADHELEDVLLQLTQVLKYETQHDSPLAEFLLRRALRNKKRLGHALCWHLKAEMHVPEIAERYGLLLEAYLRGCGDQSRAALVTQCDVLRALENVAMKIKRADKEERLSLLQSELRALKLPAKFQLPLNPRIECQGLIVEKCRYMDSKKLPLWLVFQNAEPVGNPVTVIFKAGDDLRQDVLTLQMLRLMDKLWKKQGLDLRMQPYGCIATGDQLGLIEVVLSASTTANINKEAGGAAALLNDDPLYNWLRRHNPSQLDLAKAQETFTLSAAAYCVATYVLGIGDRHNDNIMITTSGHLFHIDFGHFLGNFKKKLGFKRERAPFVFTSQYAQVLEGRKSPLFKNFVNVCQQAYNILRKHANLFIVLFMMMLSTGIPELTQESDVEYLREHLQMDKTDAQAAEWFNKCIDEALKCKTTVFNDWVHIVAHPK